MAHVDSDVDAEGVRDGMGAFAIGDGDDRHLDPEVLHALHQASDAEHLVVGMGCDDDKVAGTTDLERWQGPEACRSEPRGLVGAGTHLVDD